MVIVIFLKNTFNYFILKEFLREYLKVNTKENNFSNKEIYALFGFNKDKYTLDDFYFDKGKFLAKNIF